ncbi:uncharacterized protein LOC119104563 [Pollicipes pollicipes]|uniref:uncharacterized protein LOC119104563 n=1 Tax=Pollicipes pollicipes TaxID=41117 RepID=UPI0018859118|nr:uncharacterized protein LOC119104563 [Pollicipes pollicipes]
MKYLAAITFLTVFSSFIIATSSLKCYVCTSGNHTACEDPFDAKRANAAGFLTHCMEPTERGFKTLCRKTHQTVLGKVRVIRSCGFVNSSESCYRTRNAEVVVRSCQCFGPKDGCNAAGLAHLAPAALLLAAALRAIF